MEDIKVLKKRAKSDPDGGARRYAKYLIGMYYLNGYMVKQDKHKAMNYFIEASLDCDYAIEERLGLLIDQRGGVYNQSYIEKECTSIIKPKSKNPNYNGYSYLAEMYLAFEENKKALETLKLAEEKGSTKCYYVWGTLYHWGEVVKKDDKKAFEYFLKSAESGDYRGQREVGMCYMDGVGCEKNVEKALEYLGLATKVADNWSRLYLAKCILENKVEEEYFEAIDLLKTYRNKFGPVYNYCEALKYFNGAGVKKNPMKGFKIIDKDCTREQKKYYSNCYKDSVLKVLDAIKTGEIKVSQRVERKYNDYLKDIEREEKEEAKKLEKLHASNKDTYGASSESYTGGGYASYYHMPINSGDDGVWYFEKMHTFGACPNCACTDIKQKVSSSGQLRKDVQWVDEYTGRQAFSEYRVDPMGRTTTTHNVCKKCGFEWRRIMHEVEKDDERGSLFGKSVTDIYSTVTISQEALKPCSAEVSRRLKSFEGKYKYKKNTIKV